MSITQELEHQIDALQNYDARIPELLKKVYDAYLEGDITSELLGEFQAKINQKAGCGVSYALHEGTTLIVNSD
jgi:hypothetical protein